MNRKILIVLALIAILGAVAIVAAAIAIYSPVTTGPTVAIASIGTVTWTDNSVSGSSPPSINVGDLLTLSSTVTGNIAGGVVFWYGTSTFTEPGATGLTEIGAATISSGTATLTTPWLVPSLNGTTLYFVAIGVT